jgi:branched-chain amino acid transport system substrate-binding protein
MLSRRHALMLTGGALAALPSIARAQGREPFRLGILVPLTGSGSTYGPGILKTMVAAAEAINALGGAGGRRIEIFGEDDQTQPQAGVLAAKKLIEVNRVNAIIGGWSTGVCMAVMPLTNDANIIFTYNATSPDLSKPDINKKWLGFRMQAPATRYGNAFAEICKREGFQRVALMANNNGSSIGILDSFSAAWAAKGGRTLERVIYEPNQTSYRGELQRVLATRPDVIVAGSYLTDATVILKDWYQTGATNKWILNSWALNNDLVRAIGGTASDGMISVGPAMNTRAEAYKSYDTVYRRVMNAPGDANVDAAMNWDAITLLALALEATNGGESGEAFVRAFRAVSAGPGTAVSSFQEGRDALRRGETINYEGASSSVDFNKTNDAATGYLVARVEGGQLLPKYTLSETDL